MAKEKAHKLLDYILSRYSFTKEDLFLADTLAPMTVREQETILTLMHNVYETSFTELIILLSSYEDIDIFEHFILRFQDEISFYEILKHLVSNNKVRHIASIKNIVDLDAHNMCIDKDNFSILFDCIDRQWDTIHFTLELAVTSFKDYPPEEIYTKYAFTTLGMVCIFNDDIDILAKIVTTLQRIYHFERDDMKRFIDNLIHTTFLIITEENTQNEILMKLNDHFILKNYM